MSKREQIILIGGGGHCKACIDVIEAEDRFEIAGIVDVKEKIGQAVLGYKIIASDEDLPELAKKFKYFLITIGQTKSPLFRIEKFDLMQNLNVMLPTVTSPSAYVSKHATIGKGTIIMHRVVVNADADIGKNCIINTGVIIEHDCLMDDHVHISPGAVLSGGVSVGEGVLIGAGATVLQGVHIGKNAIVGAGAVVIKDVPDGIKVKGVPAK
jgi:sugar O-acyltransferase (sialic acid O-acetyltransferase NeuD family)